MSKKFWQNNKDHFLQYFDDYGNLSASEIYDAMVNAGAFEKMRQIVSQSSKFNCVEYLKEVESNSLKQSEEQNDSY